MFYQLKRQQLVPTDTETCWAFFSDPKNLAVITPPYMKFTVLTQQPEKVYAGLIIAYKVSPVLGIPLRWVTEIKHVRDGRFFVDEQRKGPYRFWHHEHRFEQTEKGVLMTDTVSYSLPYGFLGRIAHRLFVRRQLEAIFDYRRKVVEQLWPVDN